jgi:hypothetical protein
LQKNLFAQKRRKTTQKPIFGLIKRLQVKKAPFRMLQA